MANVRIGVPGTIGVSDSLLRDTTVRVGISGITVGEYEATRPEPRVYHTPGRRSHSTSSERVHIESGLQVGDGD
ncbi:MAG: hypothetical protein RIC36_06140 [Rhodospirillales bacterium]